MKLVFVKLVETSVIMLVLLVYRDEKRRRDNWRKRRNKLKLRNEGKRRKTGREDW